jgi:TIGR03009 family protein
MKGNPMARSMLGTAFCGLFFMAGIAWGQSTPSSWPAPNPVRQENQPNAGSQPQYQPNSGQPNQYPAATQPNNNPPGGQYPAGQPGNTAVNRNQPANQLGNQPGVNSDNRYPQLGQPGQPNQPVNPQIPTLQRRTPEAAQPAGPPPPPFILTPAQQAEIDQILNTWELKSKEVKTFDSKFVCFEYDLTFAPVANPKAPPAPISKSQGILKYAMPDKGIYHILYTEKDGKWEPTPPEQVVHWLCDGNSVFQYDYRQNKVIEHPLPPEMKGKAIADGPLPFLFGAEAKKLRDRYYFKKIESNNPTKELWLDAFPKRQADAANFSCAQLELTVPDMVPKAMRLYLPGGKNYNSYVFFETVVNDQLRLFKGNPFQPYTPRGWQKISEPLANQGAPSPQPAQAGRTMLPPR